MEFKEIKRILERELARPVEEVFEWVEEKPIAAASLAQVHRAKLRREQEEVALKIQRPYLDGIITLDTTIICDVIVKILQLALPLFRKNTDPKAFTSSFRKSLKREVDFVLEGRSQDDWRRRMAKHPLYGQVYKIARTYPEYTTTKLLTMELVKDYYRFDRIFDDLTPEEIWEMVNTKVDGLPVELPLQLAYVHGQMALNTMTRWDISHGDLHLGNFYLVKPTEKGDPWRIFLCDFGMMIESPDEERSWLAEMVAAIAYHRSGDKLVDAFARAGTFRDMDESRIDEIRRLSRMVVQNHIVPLVQGKEAVIRLHWQQSTKVNVMSAAMYQFAQTGAKWSDWWWLVMKNLDYGVNMGATFSPVLDWSEAILSAGRWWIREQVLERLQDKDITTLDDSLEEVLQPLREYDRQQVLNALLTGAEVKPLEKSWAHGHDIRFRTSS
jgi:predicted unusual protein kinase regulating ubiquinone biosynthesis (AarF/ABC1/UbiB family)